MRCSTSLQGCSPAFCCDRPVAPGTSAANGVSPLLCAPGDISILRRHRIGFAAAYPSAEAQQAAQPLSGPARQLACNMMAQFFSQPLLDGKPRLQLVVNKTTRFRNPAVPRREFAPTPHRYVAIHWMGSRVWEPGSGRTGRFSRDCLLFYGIARHPAKLRQRVWPGPTSLPCRPGYRGRCRNPTRLSPYTPGSDHRYRQ
jgi:hypothetical protein